MKNRFTTLDIKATICELNQRFLGMRVANVYDIDNRTYLIKLAMPDKKAVILLESGNRIHSTEFEWPKGMMPSGFSMKLRKHLRTRRLESIQQLGADRIVDLQFGSGEAAYHVILELYDRGNIVLTDHEYTILNLLRQRTDQDTEVRFAVRETYPVETAKQHDGVPTEERLRAIFQAAREGDNLKRILNPHLVYGPAVIEHCLVEAGLPNNAKLAKDFVVDRDMPKLLVAMENAENILQSAGKSKGYIIQKREKRVTLEEGEPQKELLTYEEFHPMLFKQHEHLPYAEFETFDKAVDEYFSQLGSQKLDNKLLQQEKSALKKLENVKKDHEKRLSALQHEQATDTQKGQLIEMNLSLVDRAIQIVCSALANQIDWGEISNLVKEAQLQKDPVACAIINLSLHTNHITMLLRDPYANSDDEEEETDDDVLKPLKVTIDLALSAHGNARKYFDMKKHAAVKEQKTMDASEKALKSAEKKTKQTLKEVQTVATINKARKTYWFEKFLWFITSENYLVVGGRDQQQNEIVVKRYLKPGDLYVHADLHGASSCILKNPTGEEVPPKTLNEAGTMAICNSAAWDAKVVTSAWWVHHHQVSKTAPTGEYLSTGSFMVRGKKNYLPPSYLIYGFGILFKVDEESIFRHKGERKVRTIDDESLPDTADAQSEVSESTEADDVEVKGSDSESSDEETDAKTQATGEADAEMATKTNTETLDSETIVKDGGEEDTKVEPTEDVKEEKDEVQFPDTSISLQHVKGDKYSLQRHHSSMSASSHHSYEDDEENIVYLGDDQPVLLAPSQPQQSATARLSAKQRRDMKKKAKHQQQVEEVQSESKPTEEEAEPTGEPMPPAQNQQKDNEPGPAPAKRGQKAKMKKMQKKYADQDEEERQRRMEILASAGGPKEDKKKNKKSKQKQQQQQQKQQQQQQQQQGKQGSQQGRAHSSKSVPQKGKLTIDDIKVETLSMEGKQEVEKAEGAMGGDDRGEDSDEEKQAILEEENIQITSDADILDSLTGLPVPEDMLMFAIPVCAPYQSLTNYKYKVKLLPGTTKRGKAAKAALNMFMHDKNMTQREKDLFKSLKDVDQARNMPGKVKVAAPNLQKSKGKR